MKTAKAFILVCLILCANNIFAKPKVTRESPVDSIVLKFIDHIDSTIIYDVEYHNPNGDSVYSQINKQFLEFDETPIYYGEVFKEKEYQIFKTTLKDGTSNYEITLYNKTGYKLIQCSFLIIKKHLNGASINFCGENCKNIITICYDKAHIFSSKDFWIQKSIFSFTPFSLVLNRKSISMEEFVNQVKILLL